MKQNNCKVNRVFNFQIRLFCIGFLLLSMPSLAQNIKGTVIDAETTVPLIDVNIVLSLKS